MSNKKYSGKKKPNDAKKNFYKKRLAKNRKNIKYSYGDGACVKRGFKNRKGVLTHKQMCLATSADENLKLYIYKCPNCKLWHVTSSEQGK